MGWKFLCSPVSDDVAMELICDDTGEVVLKVKNFFLFSLFEIVVFFSGRANDGERGSA